MSEATSVTMSESAAARVKVLIAREGDPALKLRVSVAGGGCSGFQYGFAFDREQTGDDSVIERDGVEVLVDSISLLYLAGAEIDFQEDLAGSAFRIHNPNAQSSCGCGSSFSV